MDFTVHAGVMDRRKWGLPCILCGESCPGRICSALVWGVEGRSNKVEGRVTVSRQTGRMSAAQGTLTVSENRAPTPVPCVAWLPGHCFLISFP